MISSFDDFRHIISQFLMII